MQNRIINTALCSFGLSGRVFHAPFLHVKPGFNLYGVWERTKSMAQEKYPGTKIFRTLNEILEDNSIELVIVNTPSYTHFEFAKQVLMANKHVIVEKPFTATIAQAQELIGLEKSQNKKLAVFQNRRYDSDYLTVKKILADGWLGEIVEAEFHFDRYTEQLSQKIHKETPGPAVGCLYDLGAHLIDQALQLFGMPQSVFSTIKINRPGSQVDDYFDLKLYYPSKTVILKCSYYVREPLPAYILHGKKGSFIKTRGDVQENMLQAGHIPDGNDWGKEPESEKGLLHTQKDGEIIKKYVDSFNGDYGTYYDEIYHAIVNNKTVPVSGEDGMKVIKIIEAAWQSNNERTVIDL
jgi:scyllo-inositol 2-dehydrogenase (NADP+)